MIILHDISNFMTWFVSQVVRIFTFLFNTLASFEFAGTNLLQVLLSLTILGALLPVLLTLSRDTSIKAEHNSYVSEQRKKKERS